jgi:hypothetical protein
LTVSTRALLGVITSESVAKFLISIADIFISLFILYG